ncbi:MAG: hypothetical protein ACLFUZ_01880 [Candidatus Micrarchaeia archaeon]
MDATLEKERLENLSSQNEGEREEWRKGTFVTFPEEMYADFKKLQNLLEKSGYHVMIGKDMETAEGTLQFCMGTKEQKRNGTGYFEDVTEYTPSTGFKEAVSEARKAAGEAVARYEVPEIQPKKKKPALNKKEKALMEQLEKVTEHVRDIYKAQYQTGKDYLKTFISDFEKLQKMLEGRKISTRTKRMAKAMLRGANAEFWKKYAENRLRPPKKKKEKELEIPGGTGVSETPQEVVEYAGGEPLRVEGRERKEEKELAVNEEGMKWIRDQYKNKTGEDYSKLIERYNLLKGAFDASKGLASKYRLAHQIAENTRAGYDVIQSLEKQFKKKFPNQAKAFKVLLSKIESARNSAVAASKPTITELYAWTGNSKVAKKYLDRNKDKIEKMLERVDGDQLADVLDYIDAAVKSQLEGTANPRSTPRIVLDKATDFPVVRRGLSVLYAAKGLRKPVFKKTKAKRKALRGKYILVDTSFVPELFVKPKKTDILPPVDEDGNVFIKYKGRKIYLHPDQKQVIEELLTEGREGYTEIHKPGKRSAQVDAAGADLLVQYLHEKGWTNVELMPWTGGPARAGVHISEVPEGHWDRPVALTPREEGMPERVREEIAEDRVADEMPRGPVEIEPRTKRFGRVLDRPARRSRFEVQMQKERLEYLANNPETQGTVFFENAGIARNAAKLLRKEFLGRNDLRAVSIQVLQNFWGQTEGAYLRIGELPADAFSRRSETPLSVPVAYRGGTILSKAKDRARLQDFLNGKTRKRKIMFRTGRKGKETLEAYLSRIGYPEDNLKSAQITDVEAEALEPMERQTIQGNEIWEVTLSSVPIPPAPKEEGKSVAVRGIRGGDRLQKRRAGKYYGSDAYRMRLRRWYETSAAWLKARLDEQSKEAGQNKKYFVLHGLQDPSNVYETHSQDYNRMDADQRAYTVLAADGQGFASTVLGNDKRRLFWQNGIAGVHLTETNLVERSEGARFSQDVQAKVVEHMLYMHTGSGKMRDKKKAYPEKSDQMLAVLSKYKSIDEFADALGNEYAAAAIYDTAMQLTEEALALDLAYMTLPPREQAKKKEATFDMMWRAYVSLIGFETGQTPSANPEPIQLDKCADALVNYIAGRGKNNRFKAGGHEYTTLETIVVRYNGKNVLAVPAIDEAGNINPKWTYIVGDRVQKTAPEGYSYWKKTLRDKDKILKVRTKRSWVDSIGPVGLTFKYVWGTNPPELNITGKKPPGRKREPRTKRLMVYPEYHGGHGYVAVANDLYWNKVGVSFDSRKEDVMPQLDNEVLHLSTISGEMMEGDSKFYIHPPRTRFNADGTEAELVEDYPTFRTYAYSSAYVDFNDGDAVYLFRKAGDRIGSEKFRPANARRYAGMSERELKKEGVFKIRIGTFDRFTHKIDYKEGMKEKFDKYVMGSWAANSEDLRKMTKKEKEEMVPEVDKSRHYYVVESSHTASPARESMEVGSAEDIGVTGRTEEEGGLYVGGNVPDVFIIWTGEGEE